MRHCPTAKPGTVEGLSVQVPDGSAGTGGTERTAKDLHLHGKPPYQCIESIGLRRGAHCAPASAETLCRPIGRAHTVRPYNAR